MDGLDAPARLRAWMAVENLGVKTLADELRCSEDAVSDWRRGRRVPLLVQREALEKRSDGKVPASAWTSPAADTPADKESQ